MSEFWRPLKKFSTEYCAASLDWYVANKHFIKDRMAQYAILMRLDKPIGSFLLLWPTLWALWIAGEGSPSSHLIVVFVLGVFITRSAGCVMNDFADRYFDHHVQRTQSRPMTTGKVKISEAFYLIGFLLVIALLLVLTTNRLTVLLSLVAIPLAGIYPFMKRYTYIPQFFQGLAFSWGIPMAFAAQTNAVPIITWLLLIANILWAMSYDTIYAMVDREYDLKIGIKSTAILFDEADRFFVGLIQSMMLVVFIIIGIQLGLGWYYYSSVLLAIGLVVYYHYLIRERIPELCFKAFLNNNWLGVTIFSGIVLHYFNNN